MKYAVCVVVFVISLGGSEVSSACNKTEGLKCLANPTYVKESANYLIQKFKSNPDYTSICKAVQDALRCGYKYIGDCHDDAEKAFLAIRDKFNKEPAKCGAYYEDVTVPAPKTVPPTPKGTPPTPNKPTAIPLGSSVAIAPTLTMLLIPLLVSLF